MLLQNHLKRLQTTFMNFLAETNGMLCSPTLLVSSEFHICTYISCCTVLEITQEVASRGLGLTYELCDGSTKQEMVQSLLGTLMEGRRLVNLSPLSHIHVLHMHAHRHTHTHTLTRTHACTQTHTHTHTQCVYTHLQYCKCMRYSMCTVYIVHTQPQTFHV